MEELLIDADAELAAIEHIYRRFNDAFSGELENNVVVDAFCGELEPNVVVEAFSRELEHNVVVIADVSVRRHDCTTEATNFLSATNLPVYGTPMGKTVINETSERYGGVSACGLILNHYISIYFLGLHWGFEFCCC